ncbi:hypothetical protein SEA1_gp0044 [Salmonella phage SEA1]|nr:hypothetical protein SEA1_gp0044 [Salmonella phage SEA1]
MFEGTKEEQIEFQKERLRIALTPEGNRVFPDGYAFMALWKDENEIIRHEAVKL